MKPRVLPRPSIGGLLGLTAPIPAPYGLQPLLHPTPPHRMQQEGACEHLSQITSLLCSEPSYGSISLRAKAQSSLGLTRPLSLPNLSLPTMLLTHSAPATWASSRSSHTLASFLRHGLCAGCSLSPERFTQFSSRSSLFIFLSHLRQISNHLANTFLSNVSPHFVFFFAMITFHKLYIYLLVVCFLSGLNP